MAAAMLEVGLGPSSGSGIGLFWGVGGWRWPCGVEVREDLILSIDWSLASSPTPILDLVYTCTILTPLTCL